MCTRRRTFIDFVAFISKYVKACVRIVDVLELCMYHVLPCHTTVVFYLFLNCFCLKVYVTVHCVRWLLYCIGFISNVFKRHVVRMLLAGAPLLVITYLFILLFVIRSMDVGLFYFDKYLDIVVFVCVCNSCGGCRCPSRFGSHWKHVK